ncbi:TraR/DksA family transcriptional regulator [Desulfovibrio sp. OttesenSCG-928-I05]|nr:TraR/DksA family transcriptional regulator [Desulfovibrio sp. OttesenSCG-928-I05]
MTETEKEQIRERIFSEIARIRQDVAKLTELTQPVVFEDMDDITHMDAIVNKSVNEAALASLKKRLAGLEYAGKHLDDPEFGYCQECGEPIPQKRLLSMPEANRCVDCAE